MATARALRPLLELPASVRQLLFTQQRIHCYSTSAASTTAPTTQSPSTARPASNTSSVSQTELSHFSALASSWWDPHGSSRILHLMNPLRHTFINRCLASTPYSVTGPPQIPPRKLHYLDIGCGGGIFAESAARLPNTATVTAIDPTPLCIAVAQKHARQDPTLQQPGRLTYLNTSLEELPLPATPAQGVDILSLFEVIEHITHPAPFLELCLPHVRPGGWLVLSTMSRTWTSWFTTKFVAEDVLGVVPRGTHDWNQYINVGEMRHWAKGLRGWEGMQSMGVVYVPGVGWREVKGSESWGNYFFAIRKAVE